MIRIKLIITLLTVIVACGCAKPRHIKLPPVTEGWSKHSSTINGYIVQKNETLYSIAWAFGMDYRHLAKINNLSPPYHLKYGQILKLNDRSRQVITKDQKNKTANQIDQPLAIISNLSGWIWPTNGKINSTFGHNYNRGIDIAGVIGQFIKASNSGTVVYNGTGIKSYGKLIIIKHNDDYLSAYAYNQTSLVQEGSQVAAGQQIATMGKNNSGIAVLHFEIRKAGKPINPLVYLPKK